MLVLSLNLAMALGNGTRQAKEILATIDGVSANELLAHAHELVGSNLEQLPCKIVLADGVKPVEVLTALRNPQLCDFLPVSGEQSDDQPDDQSDEDHDDAPPAAPAPARSKSKSKSKK